MKTDYDAVARKIVNEIERDYGNKGIVLIIQEALTEHTKKLEDEILVLREAVEFYADPVNWRHRTSGHGESSQDVIDRDGGYYNAAGKRARAALMVADAIRSGVKG